MQIFKNPNYDFVKYRWHAIIFSGVLLLAGAAAVWLRGIPLGVEFSGGTIVILQFEGEPPSIERVREAIGPVVEGGGGGAVVQRYGPADAREVMIRVPYAGEESGTQLSRAADAIRDAVAKANIGKFDVAGTEIVGPVVGEDLTRKGIMATALALLGILAYITFRFQFSFAVGAIVATLHDLAVMMSFLAFFQYDLTLNVIAAILTIVGYSVNDTVVIFDRVRENVRGMRRDDIRHVINVAVNQTLGRTVITAGTTFLAVLALFLFGGEVLEGFAFTMLVGIVSGTYSTVFIAAAIVSFWRRRTPARTVAAPAQGTQPAKPAATARVRTKPRKARTS
ncbi:MAG: protein translocase subunit SecF [Vicinamibacterales bacterium]